MPNRFLTGLLCFSVGVFAWEISCFSFLGKDSEFSARTGSTAGRFSTIKLVLLEPEVGDN